MCWLNAEFGKNRSISKDGGWLRSDTWWKRGGEDGVVAAEGRR